MFSFKSIVLIAAAFTMGIEGSAAPSVAAAPLFAPAAIGYTQVIPQNVPPFASQINVVNRALSPLVAAPAVAPVAYAAPIAAPIAARVAAPLAAPFASALTTPVAAPVPAAFAAPLAAPFTAPLAAPFAAPFAAPIAPYSSGAAPVFPAAYSGFPYSTPLLRSPYLAPAFVR